MVNLCFKIFIYINIVLNIIYMICNVIIFAKFIIQMYRQVCIFCATIKLVYNLNIEKKYKYMYVHYTGFSFKKKLTDILLTLIPNYTK